MTTQPELLVGDHIVDVWKRGYRLVRSGGDKHHIVLHVRAPNVVNSKDLMELDPHAVDPRCDSVLDVANTIFPKRSKWWDKDYEQFRTHYAPAYRKMIRRGRRSWGCYFLRMIEFGEGHADQLQRVVEGLSSWGWNHKAAFYIQFSSADTEKPKPLGAPCWQYVQFNVEREGILSMTAVYRSHDYFRKALGNLVGLSRLLEFVAARTGHAGGTITCVSSYAFVDVSRKSAESLCPLAQ